MRTRPVGGYTARCAFLMSLRTTSTRMLLTVIRDRSVLTLVLDQVEYRVEVEVAR